MSPRPPPGPAPVSERPEIMAPRAENKTVQATVPKRTLYLTFDDGPYDPGTAIVLRVLDRHQAPATFFLCSRSNSINGDKQYELIKKIIGSGHALGNHGDDHKPMTRGGYRGTLEGPSPMTQEERVHLGGQLAREQIEQHVVADFMENQEYFKTLFARRGDSFPGFMSARLPGDGRLERGIVERIVTSTRTPHYGWHMEFAPNNVFRHVNLSNWQGIAGAASTHEKIPHDQCIILLHDQHWQRAQGGEQILDRLIAKLKETGRLELLPKTLPPDANQQFKGQFTAYPIRN